MVKKEKQYSKNISNEELNRRLEELDSKITQIKNMRDEMVEQEHSGDLVGEPALAILKYITDNQNKSLDGDDNGITKEEITRHMDENELASRPTTLKVIDALLRANLIVNAKRRENARNRLTINPNYGLNEFELDGLAGMVKTTHKKFETLTDKNNDLVNDLLDMIAKARSKTERNKDVKFIEESEPIEQS